MSEKLWVEYERNNTVYQHRISFKGCEFVDDFIEEIRNDPRFSFVKDAEITLHGPSGTAISVGDPISSLIPGNSFTNPLRVQVPVGTDPTSAAVLTKFWNSLRGMEPENGFLKFDIKPEFIPRLMDSLYIREVYEELFEIIYKNNEHIDTKKRINRMAITGTPGTGKSVFLFYILWRLANIKSTETVILHRQCDSGRIHVFQNDGCWIAHTLTEVDGFLSDSTTWYLADTLSDPPGERNAATVLVSSPARKHYSTFLKHLPIPPLHYLPLWSLEELKLVASSYGRKPEIVEERFKKIGGVARFVLEEERELDEMIKEAVGILALNRLFSIVLGEVSKEEEISYRIVHFEVKPPYYTKHILVMASDYVLEKALRHFLSSGENDVKQFILWSDGVPSLASLRGIVFENYVHKKLSKEREFSVRSLDDGTKSTLKAPQRKFQKFWNVSECKDLNVYYKVAKKNQACIDSLIVNEGYFQVTTSLEHPIEKQKMREIMDGLGMNKLYFVVPNTIFEDFEKQNFKEDMNQVNCAVRSSGEQDLLDWRPLGEVNNPDENERQKVTETKSNKNDERNFIQQYVICIPVDARIDLSALERRRNELLALSGGEQFQTMTG